MKQYHNIPKVLNITLWMAQAVLAASLLWAAWMKLLQPTAQLAAMWPWVGQVPLALVKVTGIADMLGGLGLLLPMALRIQPKLTPIAAMLIVVLMKVATIFHLSRGEVSVVGVNIVFAAMAAFVTWGRWRG